MPPLGTAPHLVSGTWYTRTGRRLSAAGQHYWDTQLRLGRFDRSGHRTSRPQQTVRPAAPEIKKPGFETIVAARAGHPEAIHHVIAYGRHQAAKHQAAAQVDKMVGAQFGGVEKNAAHAYKVVNPKAGAVITSLSPYTALTETIHQARHHKLAPAAVSALGIWPFFAPMKAARLAKEALAAEKGEEAAASAARGVKPRFSLKHVGPEDRFHNQEGQDFTGRILHQNNPAMYDDHLTHENLIGPNGEVAGTIAYDARPGRARIYVESVYIKPKFRNSTAAFGALTSKIVADGRPIDAVFRNEKLGRLFDRMVERSRRAPGTQPGPESHVLDALGAAKTPEAQVVASLDAAKRGHATKAALQSVERSRRFAKSRAAFEAAGGGELGHAAAKAEMRGALPTVHFGDLSTLTPEQMDYLHNVVDKVPGLQPGEKLSLSDALKNAQAGVNPRPFEIKLMERVFGSEMAGEFAEQKISPWRHALDIINIPRAMMTAYDLSGGLRQNLVALFHRPSIVIPEFAKSVRYLWSKEAYAQRQAEIEADPLFPIFESHGGTITDLGRNVANREEYFPSKAAEKIPGIRASGRAFTGLSNAARFLIWKDMYEGALASGAFEKTKNVERLQRQLTGFAAIATGRGGLGKLEKIAPELNTVFFAPRLISSRVQMLTWVFNKNLDPYVRRQHLLAMSKLIAAGTAFLTGLAYAGAKVGLDPRNPDFGKARFGNTRIDIWGGHQPFVRVMAQILSGTAISSTTGKKSKLRGGGRGPFSRSSFDIIKRFTEGKLSPPAGFVDAWLNGTDSEGQPFSVRKQIRQDIWPLVAQDAVKVANQTHSPLWGVGAYALAGLGVGVQSYGPRKPKPKPPSGGSDPFGSIFTDDSSDPFGSLFTG